MELGEIFNIRGKRIIITGAGKGIGLSVARMLSLLGAQITLIARNKNDLINATEEIKASGGDASWASLDITDISALKASTVAGDVYDVIINNAGMNRPSQFTEVTEDDYDNVMNLNVRGTYFFTQHFVRNMIRAGRGGSVINITSQMGHVGARDRTVYCASKFAIEGLTKALAVELGQHQIRVNTLAPTFIETPMTSSFLADENFRANVLDKIKLGRMAMEKDLFGAILMLSSDASSMMTGSSILIDGGWTSE